MVPGLCSVTFRGLSADAVAAHAAGAGLHAIEWGADVHAPVGDAAELWRVRELTYANKLAVASYGSYFLRGPAGDFAPVLTAAVTLGAKRIRIWAGAVGSAEADRDAVRDIVTATKEAARMAAERRVELAFEFHHGTLTDTVDSTLRLLDAVDEPNVSTYWQPPLDASVEDAVVGLARLGERVCALHVFSWWPGRTRLPLAARSQLWQAVFASVCRPMDALLEFLPDNDPELLAAESATLTELLAR